jgi:hypothetical protein
MIIRTRNRLISAALAFREKGVVPPGVDEPMVDHQRSGGLIIDDADRGNWFEVTASARAAFVEHPKRSCARRCALRSRIRPGRVASM